MRSLWALAFLVGPACAWGAPAIEFEEFTLKNGMRVILSRDATVPVVAQAMIFRVGARQEVPGRSGFAHLFEHLMFEGSRNVPKGGFDRILETYGGDNNASTHLDFTFYYEVVPSNALPVSLWLDADRVGGLKVSRRSVNTQIEVVKEERRMRVDNEPYGALLNVDIASHSFQNWQNAHPTMGSYSDLNAARHRDVKDFFKEHYAPRNAIMAIVGDIDPVQVKRWVKEYFEDIPNRAESRPVDTTEPRSVNGKTYTFTDVHANLPALAISWKGMPERGTKDYYALTLLGRALFTGKSSRLYQGLVKVHEAAVYTEGGLGFPVSSYSEYMAPGLFGGFIILKKSSTHEEVRKLTLKTVGKVAVSGLKTRELARVKTKFRADWIAQQQTGLGRARMLLLAALFDGGPEQVNKQLDRFMAVTSSDIRKAAAKYLGAEKASIFEVSAGGAK